MLAVIALLAGMAVVPTADAVGTSLLSISATSNVPRYPCFLQDAPCRAELVGGASGTLVGQLPGGSWSVSLLDARLLGSFDYVHGSDCSTGAAAGSLTVQANPQGLTHGTLLADDEPGRDVVGLRLRADFTWQQAGAQTSAFLANVAVELKVVGQGWTAVASGLKGAGSTSYVPDLGGVDPFECSWLLATNPPPARVAVVGTLGVAGA